jgi:hypothetical protein
MNSVQELNQLDWRPQGLAMRLNTQTDRLREQRQQLERHVEQLVRELLPRVPTPRLSLVKGSEE